LQSLDLSGIKVTDAGLKALKELKNLQVLDIDRITDEGVEDLQKALPNLTINRPIQLG
jgi:selenocysteine-specific translation elongation factor